MSYRDNRDRDRDRDSGRDSRGSGRDSRDSRDSGRDSGRDNRNNNYKRERYDERDEDNKRLRELQTYSDSSTNRYRSDKKKSFKDKEQIDYSKYEFGRREDREREKEDSSKPKVPKEKPDFKPSGALLKDAGGGSNDDDDDSNKVKLKWVEPSEASFPKDRWVIYPFRGKDALDPIYLRKKAYLFGRDRDLADIATEHPSCSSQHAVLVFRKVKKEDKETGDMVSLILPYLIDLESTNGTFYNDNKLESSRYLELKSKDSIRFGQSSREYILLREDSVSEDESDD